MSRVRCPEGHEFEVTDGVLKARAIRCGRCSSANGGWYGISRYTILNDIGMAMNQPAVEAREPLPKWRVTVHYFDVEEGKRNELQTKSTVLRAALLSDAIESALDEWGMVHAEDGAFQITASTYDDFGGVLE